MHSPSGLWPVPSSFSIPSYGIFYQATFHNNFKTSPDLTVALYNLVRLFLDNQLSIAKYDISALLVVLCTSMKYLKGGGGCPP